MRIGMKIVIILAVICAETIVFALGLLFGDVISHAIGW
jgi:hypothetical protein